MSPDYRDNITLYDARDINIFRDSDSSLKARFKGDENTYCVTIACCFPLTNRYHCISLIQTDAERKTDEELAVMLNPQNLDRNSRLCITKELEIINNYTWITKIYSMKRASNALLWDCELQENRCTIEVRNENDVCAIQPNFLLISDPSNNRYFINTMTIDPKSLSLLEIYL